MSDFCACSVVLENTQVLVQVQTCLLFFPPWVVVGEPLWFVLLFDNKLNLGAQLRVELEYGLFWL